MAREVTASISRKVSDGNFGSTEIGFVITDEIKPDEKVSEAANRVYMYVEKLLNDRLTENELV